MEYVAEAGSEQTGGTMSNNGYNRHQGRSCGSLRIAICGDDMSAMSGADMLRDDDDEPLIAITEANTL